VFTPLWESRRPLTVIEESKKQTRNDQIMKTKYLRACILPMVAGGFFMLGSGCVVEPNGRLAFQPFVVVAPSAVYVSPPLVVEAPAMVPDSYAWDGVEYVGLVGDQYFYLGAGDVWLVCDPFRLDRFHGWERGHPDWRSHAIRNDRFRTDRNGHVQPRHDDKSGKAAPAKKGEQEKNGH
jgi:hypothetical protein